MRRVVAVLGFLLLVVNVVYAGAIIYDGEAPFSRKCATSNYGANESTGPMAWELNGDKFAIILRTNGTDMYIRYYENGTCSNIYTGAYSSGAYYYRVTSASIDGSLKWGLVTFKQYNGSTYNRIYRIDFPGGTYTQVKYSSRSTELYRNGWFNPYTGYLYAFYEGYFAYLNTSNGSTTTTTSSLGPIYTWYHACPINSTDVILLDASAGGAIVRHTNPTAVPSVVVSDADWDGSECVHVPEINGTIAITKYDDGVLTAKIIRSDLSAVSCPGTLSTSWELVVGPRSDNNVEFYVISSTAFKKYIYDGNACSLVAEGPVVGQTFPTSSSYTMAKWNDGKIVAIAPTTDSAGKIVFYQYRICSKYIQWNVKMEDGTTFDPANVDSYNVQIFADDGSIVYSGTDTSGYICGDDYNTTQFRITASITVGSASFSRTKYVENTDGLTPTIYIPDWNTALFYTIYLTDTSGVALSGHKLVIEKFLSSENAYISVSEAYPGPDGSTSHFLTPSTYYKVKVYDPDGKLVGDYDWYADPNVRTITIRIGAGTSSGGLGTPQVEYNIPWDTVTVTVVPDKNEDVNAWPYPIMVTVADGSASLQETNITIYKAVFDTNIPRLDVQITDPAGGTVEYNAYSPGLYIVRVAIKKDGQWYELPPRSVLLGSPSFIHGSVGLTDFSYILLATIIALSVAGFVAQFSPGGGAILGLIVLGMFTYFNPSASIIGISMWNIFLLTTVIVLAVALIRTYI